MSRELHKTDMDDYVWMDTDGKKEKLLAEKKGEEIMKATERHTVLEIKLLRTIAELQIEVKKWKERAEEISKKSRRQKE